MKQIQIIPVVHRQEKRLLVKFDYDVKLISIIKKVEGATFSITRKSWHVANNPEKLKELFRVFKGFASVDTTAVFDKIPFLTEKKPIKKLAPGNYEDNSDVRVQKSEKKVEPESKVKVELDKEEEKNKKGNLPNGEASTHQQEAVDKEKIEGEPLFDPERKGRIVLMNIIDEKKIILRFPFAKAHVAKVKTLPYYQWHKAEKYWSFPYTPNIKSEIESYFAQFGFEIECSFRKSKNKDLKEKKYYSNDRKIPVEYLEMLKIKRYSENTITTYKKAFSDYINYFQTRELDTLTGVDIKDYLLYLIEKRKISASLQHTIINAIKFYYEKVLKLDKLPYITIAAPF